MFATAVAHASEFTNPVVISTKTIGGKVTTSCGSFVLINDEGWIITAAQYSYSCSEASTRGPVAFVEHLKFLSQLDDAAVGQDAAKVYAGINHAILSED